MTDAKPDDDAVRDDAVHEPPPVPQRPPEAGGGPVGPRPHPGDYGATEDEQRRVVGRPREETP